MKPPCESVLPHPFSLHNVIQPLTTSPQGYYCGLLANLFLSSSVQFSHSVMSHSLQPHGLQHARLPFTIFRSLLKLMSIELVMPSNHFILYHPPPSPPALSLSSIRVFTSESDLHIRWPKHWSFSFSISPSSEYSGLISFRMDWFDLPHRIHSLIKLNSRS